MGYWWNSWNLRFGNTEAVVVKVHMLHALFLRKNERHAAVTHTLELFNALSRYTEVELFVPDHPDFRGHNAIHTTKRIDCNKLPYFIRYLLDNLVFIFSYIKYYKKHKPDLVYYRGFIPWPIILGVPFVVEINGIRSHEFKYEQKSVAFYLRFLSLISKIFERIMVRKAKLVFAVTSPIRDYLHEEHGINIKKIVVTPNGANTELFKPIKSKIEYDLGFAGNLTKWQGVEYLIEAIHYLVRRGINVTLIIIGDGILRHELEDKAETLGVKDRITFFGLAKYEEIPLLLSKARILVSYKVPLPSGYSPLKLYEYLSLGKPVIVSDVKGFEFIKKLQLGEVVRPEDSVALANSIEKLMFNPKLRKKYGLKGRKYVERNHSWLSIARRIHKYLKNTLKIKGENELI